MSALGLALIAFVILCLVVIVVINVLALRRGGSRDEPAHVESSAPRDAITRSIERKR